MSLPNCSNDHTAVLSSVDNTCQQQFRSAASFPAQKEVCRLAVRGKQSCRRGAEAGREGVPVLGSAKPGISLLLSFMFICLFIFWLFKNFSSLD